jgi:PQQ-like domain
VPACPAGPSCGPPTTTATRSGAKAVAAAASPDGSTVYVTGLTGLAHFSTLAYNAATGAPAWTATFYGRGYSQPSAMAVSPDGSKVFVTGFTTPPGACCADQFVTVAYDAATGARLWARETFNILHVGSFATAVAVSPDGSSVFVAGDAGKNPVVVAYNAATGAQQWLSRYQVPLGAPGGTEGIGQPGRVRGIPHRPVQGTAGRAHVRDRRLQRHNRGTAVGADQQGQHSQQ